MKGLPMNLYAKVSIMTNSKKLCPTTSYQCQTTLPLYCNWEGIEKLNGNTIYPKCSKCVLTFTTSLRGPVKYAACHIPHNCTHKVNIEHLQICKFRNTILKKIKEKESAIWCSRTSRFYCWAINFHSHLPITCLMSIDSAKLSVCLIEKVNLELHDKQNVRAACLKGKL